MGLWCRLSTYLRSLALLVMYVVHHVPSLGSSHPHQLLCKVLTMLKRLIGAGNTVIIISGRDRETMDEWFISPLFYTRLLTFTHSPSLTFTHLTSLIHSLTNLHSPRPLTQSFTHSQRHIQKGSQEYQG